MKSKVLQARASTQKLLASRDLALIIRYIGRHHTGNRAYLQYIYREGRQAHSADVLDLQELCSFFSTMLCEPRVGSSRGVHYIEEMPTVLMWPWIGSRQVIPYVCTCGQLGLMHWLSVITPVPDFRSHPESVSSNRLACPQQLRRIGATLSQVAPAHTRKRRQWAHCLAPCALQKMIRSRVPPGCLYSEHNVEEAALSLKMRAQ